jgi:hypothetical protein
MEERFGAVGLNDCKHRLVNRGNRARMTARKSDQVLVGLFGSAEPLAQMRHGTLFEWDHRRHGSKNKLRTVNFLQRLAGIRRSSTQNKSGGVLRRRRLLLELEWVLVQVVRHVVERGVQLVADALHSANRRNGDESGDQAVLDGGCTLLVTNQLEKLAHGHAPWFHEAEDASPCKVHIAGCLKPTS